MKKEKRAIGGVTHVAGQLGTTHNSRGINRPFWQETQLASNIL